jgi:hypothetical protein
MGDVSNPPEAGDDSSIRAEPSKYWAGKTGATVYTGNIAEQAA